MSINVRTKGQTGEREVADALNLRLYVLFKKYGWKIPAVPPIQRNQNQSAVGGSDLTNKMNLAIEVKRQEQLSVNTWWKQCVASAERSGQVPILIYRQNRQAWRVVMNVNLLVPRAFANVNSLFTYVPSRAEITWDDFLHWFDIYADHLIHEGVNLYAD